MMNAMQNIIEGTKDLAIERETKLADVQAKMKLERGEAGGEAPADVAEAEALEVDTMSPEQMAEAITLLSSAVMTLTNRLDGGNE